MFDTRIEGVQIFRVVEAMPCVPAVYEPTLVAIVSGEKEAIVDGNRHVYDSRQYLLCPMTLPVEAGTPHASPDTPLVGVSISLNPQVMRELSLEMETAMGVFPETESSQMQGLSLANWDRGFTQALLRLLELLDDPTGAAVLGKGRLREVYFALLSGEAGRAARRAFGVGNEIARTIDYLSDHLGDQITIEDMASRVGMSRAVFHRRFKEATGLSPLQFMKSLRLNKAAAKISEGTSVSEAAWTVGYTSSSQFSREFKRMYGTSPQMWKNTTQFPAGIP